MAKYPIFLELSGWRVVVIGGGTVALRKVEALLETEARIVVLAERIDNALVSICKGTSVKLIESEYSRDYLTDALLAMAATNDHELNKQIYKDCQELGILCNVVDEPDLCDFYVPAVVKCGNLQIAISTEGRCPAYARHIREKLEKTFTDEHSEFLIELEKVRKQIISQVPSSERKGLLSELVSDESFEYFIQNGSAKWQVYAANFISGKD